MTAQPEQPPGAIRLGVRNLSSIPGVHLESGPFLIPEEDVWALRLRLSIAKESDFVPSETGWIVLIDPSYPAGRIRLYPCIEGGITHTFPHQDRNVPAAGAHSSWRLGKPCLDSPLQRLGRIAGGPEPTGDAELRLRWHVARCISWLEAAVEHQLMVPGEPFEIPQCPTHLAEGSLRIVHDEGPETWRAWSERVGDCGEVRLGILAEAEKTIIVEEFIDARGNRIRQCRHGLTASEKPWVGYWWLWPAPVVLLPWRYPDTWGDLRRIGKRLGADVDRFIYWLARRCAGEKPVVLLLGYPIPRRWHEDPVEVHWQAILAPEVPRKIEPMKGFRANSRGIRERLRRDIFSGTKKLVYLRTENWHPDRLQARGRIQEQLRGQRVAIIGVGALGSCVAELLVRGGVEDVLLIDRDVLEAGNLVRHTLTVGEIGHNKAEAVAERLRAASPMADVRAHPGPLPMGTKLQELLEPFQVVLDCTGDDVVLHSLAEAWWPVPRLFLSTSTGFAAHRLFIFVVSACTFPWGDFREQVRPWLDAEKKRWTEAGETLEGAGCWSPLFRARNDDIWLAAVTTLKLLERAVATGFEPGLHVFEQLDGPAAGFRLLDRGAQP